MSPTYPATVEGLTAALAALGDTEEKVAETLTAGGFTGDRNDCDFCPVASYLATVIPGPGEVVVLAGTVAMWPHGDMDPRVTPLRLAMPRPVERFVFRFDVGAYPALVFDAGGAL